MTKKGGEKGRGGGSEKDQEGGRWLSSDSKTKKTAWKREEEALENIKVAGGWGGKEKQVTREVFVRGLMGKAYTEKVVKKAAGKKKKAGRNQEGFHP